MIFSDEELSLLVRAGRKVSCPICGKSAFSQEYRAFHSSGIGSHIKEKHPELIGDVYAASKRMEQKEKEEKIAREKEKRERPFRKFLVTGAFLDEIKDEIEKLIGCMEAYYLQANCADTSEALISRIEKMHKDAREAEREAP